MWSERMNREEIILDTFAESLQLNIDQSIIT